MSMHSSLKQSAKAKQHRSVLKRLERLLHLIKKDEWKKGDSVFGLPKIKVLKYKIKKEKVKEAEEAVVAAGAEGAVEGEAAPAAEGEKPEAKKPGPSSGKEIGKKEKEKK